MRKILLGLLIVTCFAQQGMAQNIPPPPAELSVGKRDTLRAIGNLFERRRKGGKRWAYVGGIGLLTTVRAVTGAGSTVHADGVLITAGVFVGIPAAASIGNLLVYSEKREDEVDRAYRSGHPLPKRIRRRLKKKDFK